MVRGDPRTAVTTLCLGGCIFSSLWGAQYKSGGSRLAGSLPTLLALFYLEEEDSKVYSGIRWENNRSPPRRGGIYRERNHPKLGGPSLRGVLRRTRHVVGGEHARMGLVLLAACPNVNGAKNRLYDATHPPKSSFPIVWAGVVAQADFLGWDMTYLGHLASDSLQPRVMANRLDFRFLEEASRLSCQMGT
jgi:hypothetical protein